MQTPLVIMLVLFVVVFACAFVANALPALQTLGNVTNTDRAPEPCPIPQEAVPLLRAFNPSIKDHFYTTDTFEFYDAITNHNYFNRDRAGFVYPTQVGDTQPLYRLWSEEDRNHFYTTSGDIRNILIRRGYLDKGNAGYVFVKQYCGSVPLYRLFHKRHLDHFYTADRSERDEYLRYKGYEDQGIAAYVVRRKGWN